MWPESKMAAELEVTTSLGLQERRILTCCIAKIFKKLMYNWKNLFFLLQKEPVGLSIASMPLGIPRSRCL